MKYALCFNERELSTQNYSLILQQKHGIQMIKPYDGLVILFSFYITHSKLRSIIDY